jgi:hypothetical protein
VGDDDDFSALRNRVLHGRVGPATDAQCGAGTYQYLERTLSDSDTTYIIITSVYLVAFVLLILWKEDQKLAEKILCAILAAVALWAMWFFFMGGARFA